MARQQVAAVIDFGSSKISVMIAEKGVNNTFNILGRSEIEYGGYLDGEFLNKSELFTALGHAINGAETMARTRISEVFVGVPGEFTSVIVKEPTLTFPNKRKITGIEIEQLFNVGNTFENNADFLLINRSPIFYTLEDGTMMIDASESKTKKLTGQLSYVLATKKFTDLITELLLQYDIKKIEFMSTCLAECMYLIDATERDRFAVLIDVGYTTTSVMLMRGDGLLYLKSFAVGGGHITADLYEYFQIPFPVAEELKRKVSLTFAVSSNEEYHVETKTKKYSFSCAEVHKVVEARLDIIAKMVQKCISLCAIEFPSYINYKLTGGGISYMRGAKEYVGRRLGKNIEHVKNSIPQYDSPQLSSTFALLSLAMQKRKTGKNLFERVLK